jgi:hypothetical protein
MKSGLLCAATDKSSLGRRVVELSRSQTHPVGLLCTSDRLIAEAATYTTYSKHNRHTSIPAAR